MAIGKRTDKEITNDILSSLRKKQKEVNELTPEETRAQKKMYSPWTGKPRVTERKTALSTGIDIAKRRFEIENGRPPTGKEVIDLMRSSFQKVEKDRMGEDRWRRAQENNALRKKMEEELKRQQIWEDRGSGYEAMSDAGEKRAEAERIRYNKMVDPEWKPSDDTWTGRQKILRNMDARNKALDPENDPGFLSSLRNKFNISPTNAEVERRLMARNNAREEEARLHEGEAEGAIAGTASERIRQARAKEMADRDARINQESTLDSTAMDSEALEDYHQDQASEKMAGLDRIDPSRPDMYKTLYNTGPDSEAREEAEIDQASEMQTIDDSFPSFEGDERAARRAQEDMQNMSDDEKNEVVKIVQDTKGKQSEEAIAAKEATGDYVRYEGTGFVINKRALDKAFDRQEKMELLQNVPQANRAAMLYNWGFIDKKDLDTAQQQSAKDIKELTLLDLRIKESEAKIATASNKLGEADKLKYQSHSTGFRQAVKDGDWETAEYFHSQMNSLLPKGSQDNVDFAELKKKQEERLRKKTPSRIFQDAGLGKDGKAYYDSVDGIMKKVNFIKNSTNKGSEWDRLMSQSLPTATGEGAGTYGEFLKTQGIYSWKDIKAGKITKEQLSKMPGITEDALVSEEAYMSWALPKIQNKLALGIWGNVHTDVQRALGILKKKTIEEAQKTVNTPAGLEEKQLKPKVTKPIKKKIKPKPKSEPEVVETNKKETEGLGDLSLNEKSRLRPHRHSSSAGRTKYNDLTKRINRMEKYIKDNKSALSSDEIKDRNRDIEMLKLRASQFKEKWEESEQKIKEELESIKLQRELKAYNKKRVAEGFKALRYPEYQRLKREGKIK